MPWFKVDDNLGFHHKVIAAGNPAMGLWVRAGSICAQQLTDGFVPAHMVAALGTVAQANRLVGVGLWDETQGGYRFHGWAERQPSKVDVEAERASAKERMRTARARKRAQAQQADPQVNGVRSPSVRENTDRTSGEVREKFGNPDPTRPDPSRPDPPIGSELTLAASDAPTSQSLISEWIDHCPERPPSQVVGQIAKHVGSMLGEGVTYELVRAGLAEWNTRDLHPSVLPSIVHGLANRKPRTSTKRAEDEAMFERQMQRAIAREAGQP